MIFLGYARPLLVATGGFSKLLPKFCGPFALMPAGLERNRWPLCCKRSNSRLAASRLAAAKTFLGARGLPLTTKENLGSKAPEDQGIQGVQNHGAKWNDSKQVEMGKQIGNPYVGKAAIPHKAQHCSHPELRAPERKQVDCTCNHVSRDGINNPSI